LAGSGVCVAFSQEESLIDLHRASDIDGHFGRLHGAWPTNEEISANLGNLQLQRSLRRLDGASLPGRQRVARREREREQSGHDGQA
jgi:hypothetical protein